MRLLIRHVQRSFLCGLLCVGCLRAQQTPAPAVAPAHPAAGQAGANESDADDSDSGEMQTVFPHSQTARWWISGAANVVFQGHGAFPAKYSGPNSLTNWAQTATTHLLTLYTGYALTPKTEVFADIEDATGNGIGNASGMAGYVNLDSVRVVQGVQLSKTPYLAQAMVREIIPLSSKKTDAVRDELDLATSLPERRLEIRAGKFDLTNFFDTNTYGTDSNLQFLNWSVDDNATYDVAANTRGYTEAVMVEYDDRTWSARFAGALMPKTANGTYLDADLARARGQNLELEARGKHVLHRDGTVRLLSYLNRANMGSYRQALAEFEAGKTATPEIVATRRQGRHKYGFGLNLEQQITDEVGVFGRLGWSDGHNESFCFTEDDRTAQVGTVAMGGWWRRASDRVGAAFAMNGIVAGHQEYLARGGVGFILGDGALTYGREKIVETFYTAHLWRGFFASYDFQHVNNPGYNQARGPVAASGLRFHTDF